MPEKQMDRLKTDEKAHKAVRTAAQTATLMAILTLVSKLFGFVREMVMAAYFGTSYVTDAYVMAFNIPTMIFGGIFGAVATAYMPIFSELTETRSREAGIKFTNETINLLLIVSIISSIVGLVFSDGIVSIFAMGFEGEVAELTSFFVKVTFSYVILTSTCGLLEAYLRYKGVFLLPIVTGYIQNLIVIAGIIISAYYTHYCLVFGWLAGYLIRLIIISYCSKKKGMSYKPIFRFGDSARRIVALSLPVFIGSGLGQINLFIDKMLASGLPEGSVSALNYGNLLIGLVTGLTTSIIMTVIYPKMTQAYALQEDERFSGMISTGFNLMCIILIPATFGILLYSNQIVQVVYERGAFDVAATDMTGQAFFFYAIGMLFGTLNGLYTQAYYSMQNMKTPVLCSAVAVVINIALNLILVQYMAHCGLALATSIASICNALLLHYGLRRKYKKITIVQSVSKIVKITIGAAVSVGCSYGLFLWISNNIWNNGLWLPRMVALGLVILLACVVYLGVLKLLKIEELEFIRQLIRSKKKKQS